MLQHALRHLTPITRLAAPSSIAAVERLRFLHSTMPKGAAAVRGRKRAAADDCDDDGFVAADESTAVKKAKTAPSAKAKQVDNEGKVFWELSARRRVTVSEFKGKQMVDIREYYERDGVALPGKKGISLNPEQYNDLMGLLPEIEATLAAKGETVVRPNFEGSGPAAASNAADDADNAKPNYEATSDEDDK